MRDHSIGSNCKFCWIDRVFEYSGQMIPNLSIRQLQTFREIMRSGSVTGASRVLGRTQPSVSAMLASLEAELGFELFERHKGRLIPKPEAHFFFEETQEIGRAHV